MVDLKYLYRSMLRIRMVEEKIAEVYGEQKMRCPVHLSIGQEAVAAGVCATLKPSDYVLSNHRSHGHYMAKRGSLRALIAELYGKATGCSHGKGGSMHLVDLSAGFLGATPIVGSTIAIAAGVAFGLSMRGDRGKVTVVFFGEGATEEGVFHETLDFAALKRLPIVMVCENNLYSVYSPLSVRQASERDLMRIAQGHGIASARGDGNEVEEVYRIAHAAVERARRGDGPSLLAFATYRWREHCGPNYDNNIGYRSEAEFLEWRRRCPIEAARRRLLESHAVDEDGLRALSEEIVAEIEDAFRFAGQSPFPDPALMQEHVYAL